MLAGARHGDIKETAFLLDPLRVADRHVRSYAAVRDVEHGNSIPFLPLCRMYSRQHEVVFIEMRRTRVGTGGLVDPGSARSESRARLITPCNLLQLIEIGRSRRSIVVKMQELVEQPQLVHDLAARSAYP